MNAPASLHALLRAGGLSPDGVPDRPIAHLTADSRTTCADTLFVAISGTHQDGATFARDAVARGAVAIVSNALIECGVPVIQTASPRHALALMAAFFAGAAPSHLVAITGTNGKSSTADFVRQLWALSGKQAASLGTLGLVGAPDGIPNPPPLTTPDPVALSTTLAALARAGVDHVALEASSHGLEQERLGGLHPIAAGFSNLTRDHLDYHGTMEAYRAAKLRLFTDVLPKGGIAAINADMDATTVQALRDIAKARGLTLRSVGLAGETLRLIAQTPTAQGQILTVEANGQHHDIEVPLVGRFQADNILLATALAAGPDEAFALDLWPKLLGVRGRLERAARLENGAGAYVDYAHTPDALERLLTSLRPHASGRLICVFGAGGDRDRGKRPIMGEITSRLADIAIVTDDNPRTENAADIRREIMAGCPEGTEIDDRAAAIAAGLDMLRTGDVLVVAGKGHEQGQIVGKTVLPFDDCDVIRRLTGARA